MEQRSGPINQLQTESYDGQGPISLYISRILLAHTPQSCPRTRSLHISSLGCHNPGNTISIVIENQPPENQTLDDVVNMLNAHRRKLTAQAIQAAQVMKQVTAYLDNRKGQSSF
jgi:hypothetical protein